MRTVGALVIVLGLLLTACGGGRQEDEDTAQRAQAGGEAAPMPGMRMPSMDMLPGVRTYLDSVVAAEPAAVATMVANHRARVEPMLAAMEQDMTAMNMPSDSAWQALADSVRADLATLPGLDGEDLVLRLRGHAGRMRRLLERHEAMMRM